MRCNPIAFQVLLLTSLALARPTAQCPHTGADFRADFAQPHRRVEDRLGTAYGWEGKTSPMESQIVMVFKQRHASLNDLRGFLMKSLARGSSLSQGVEIRQGAFKGLELEGMTEAGVPFMARVVQGPHHDYLCASITYDTALNRKFVQGFHLHPR